MIKNKLFTYLYPLIRFFLKELAKKSNSEKKILKKINDDINFFIGKGAGGPKSIALEIDSINKLVSEDNINLIIDVGANEGGYSALLLETYPDAKIICFEPSKFCFNLLKNKFNGFKNIQIENIALSSKDGDAYLYSDLPGSGLGSLSKRRLDHFNIDFEYSEKIKTQKLDTYINKYINNKVIDFMKLDVEGHELEVLKGGGQTLNQIKLIQFEFGGCNIDSRTYFQDLWYFFKNYNFEIYRITPFGIIKIDKYEESDEYFKTTNYFALNKNLVK